MQGTAADIIKRAMIRTQDWLVGSGAPAALVLQVHDELVLEVEQTAVAEIRERLSGIMSSAAELAVPLVVDTGVGPNWDEAH